MKNSILKKVLAVLLMVIMCCALTNIAASAELAQPTNKIITNGNGGKTDVGVWFVTYNNSREWVSNFGTGYPIRYRALLPDGSYGILDSENIEHIDFQLKELANAKVDFILYDITNGGLTDKLAFGWKQDDSGKMDNYIIKNAMLTSERIALWNKNNDWKIRYAVAVGTYPSLVGDKSSAYASEVQAEATYKLFCENKTYGKDYYTMDGKPLLVLFDWTKSSLKEWEKYKGDKTYGDKFALRDAIQGHKGTYGWQASKGAVLDDEVILISPGHDNTAGETTVSIPRKNGEFYKECWKTILTNKLPRIVMISSFNDYNEQTAIWPADSSKCREGYEEKWYDKTGKLNPTMYWDMTKDAIRLMRGANGEIKTEMKSVWFDIGENSSSNDSVNDKNQTANGDKNNSLAKTDKNQTANGDKNNSLAKTDNNSVAIIIIIVAVGVILLCAGLIIFVFKNKKHLK